MLAKRIRPQGDKNHSFQVIGCDKETRDIIVAKFDNIKFARPFLQGDSNGWVMVEFWTNEPMAVEDAVIRLLDAIRERKQCEYGGIGDDFTKDELYRHGVN